MTFNSRPSGLHKLGLFLISISLLGARPALAQYSWTTLAGRRTGAGYTDGPVSAALLNLPRSVAVSGNTIYVADSGNNLIRQVTVSASGSTVSTLAGQINTTGTSDGVGTLAAFNTPTGVALDGAGNLYVADSGNNTIRKISFSGTTATVSTLAGLAGVRGVTDGIGSIALFYGPTGVATDPAGDVYVADAGNHAIRKVTPAGVVTTVAGLGGVSGVADGSGSAARFFDPIGLIVDASGNIFVADSGNDAIRVIRPDGYVSTVAGTPGHSGQGDGTTASAQFNFPTAVATDTAGNIYVADYGNNTLRVIANGFVSTLAGTPGVSGSTGNFFYRPAGVTLSNGQLYVADSGNGTIRLLNTDGSNLITIAGNATAAGFADGLSALASFSHPAGVALDGTGNVFIADPGNNVIREVTFSGSVITVAGVPNQAGTADGIGNNLAGLPGLTGTSGTTALLDQPTGIVAASSTNFYFTDAAKNTVRQLSLSGSGANSVWTVTTIAGVPGVSGSNDGIGTSGSAAANFNGPTGISYGIDQSSGDAFLAVADSGNAGIRYIDLSLSASVFTLISGLNQPVGVATDGFNIFVADAGNNTIESTDVFGNPITFFATGLFGPQGVALDVNGDVYVTDTRHSVIDMFTPTGNLTVIGGTTGVFANVDGVGSAARFYAPTGIAVDSGIFPVNVYAADTGNNRIIKGMPLPAFGLLLNSSSTSAVSIVLTSTSQVAFGVLPVRTSTQLTFTCTNSGLTTLTGLAPIITGTGGASDFAVPPLPVSTLAPGASITFPVTFAPTQAGARIATLTVKDANDPVTPSLSILLSGTGVDNGEPVISVRDQSGNILNTPANLNFADGIVNGINQQRVDVSNLGIGPLQFLSFNITGPKATDFRVAEPQNPSSNPVPPPPSRFTSAPSAPAPGRPSSTLPAPILLLLPSTSCSPVPASPSRATPGTSLASSITMRASSPSPCKRTGSSPERSFSTGPPLPSLARLTRAAATPRPPPASQATPSPCTWTSAAPLPIPMVPPSMAPPPTTRLPPIAPLLRRSCRPPPTIF